MMYIDDILIAAKNKDEVDRLNSLLMKEFNIKCLGATKKILGMEIHRVMEVEKL